MGKKYIIDLNPDCVEGEYLRIPARIAGEQQWLMTKAALTPYTEPDLEQVRKEAYEQGYHIGYSKYLNKSFEDGLKGSWEAARKIICEMDYEEHMKIFGGDNLDYIFALSPTTVIEKLKAYEQEQKEIKVGDEVCYYGVADEHGNVCYSGVVLEIRKDDYLVMEKSGKTYQLKKKLVMSKTGRHFPEIASVLQKMRGEQE